MNEEMREAQLKELLTLSYWKQLTPIEQEETALALAARLPEPFRFTGLETYALGQQCHRVASFTYKEAHFALIPGGPATLGYAPGSFRPTAAHRESWEETLRRYPAYPDLETHLTQRLTPLRQVLFKPFLLEVIAIELSHVIIENGRRIYRYPGPRISYPQAQERIAQDGFRFPTSDEWEYACAAEARTLWRWGNEISMILVPSRRNLPEWDLHLRPNAFELLIGDAPAHWEFTAEEGVMRGGDGGTASRAGQGRLVEWLILAPAYWKQLNPRLRVPRVYIRRMYSLFQ